ncbi:MAG: group III truncated hemoglobin [Candidatus Kapabacteria bacterium]|nr:group III truncated hemoglobin [Candidatus Kapabacteria bacterium]
MKLDIKTIDDIEQLVNQFYDKVKADETIGFLFEEVARVDWETHLPRMYEFWNMVIFGEGGFVGNPMAAHMRLNVRHPLTHQHFARWKSLFYQTIDELFEGEVAEQTKTKAKSIASIMEQRVTIQPFTAELSIIKPTSHQS